MTSISSQSLWRYKAVPIGGSAASSTPQTGELAGANPADVRAALRKVGLQVIDLRPAKSTARTRDDSSDVVSRIALSKNQLQKYFRGRGRGGFRGWGDFRGRGGFRGWGDFRGGWDAHLRRRRQGLKSELFDGLATMLQSGLPLLEAVTTLIDAQREGRSKSRSHGGLLAEARESLKAGESFAQTLRRHQSWFSPPEVAMIEAAEHSGSLPSVLFSLAERTQHADDLRQRLIGALAYPTLVTLVGIGVTIFLSVKTLPQLVKILTDAKIAPPSLTLGVMSVGQTVAHHPFAIIAAILGTILLAAGGRVLLRQFIPHLPGWVGAQPRVLKNLRIGQMVLQLAELLRAGVPMTDALKVLAPTAGTTSLREALNIAALRIESGDDLVTAFSDERWFDAEFRRLLEVGQMGGSACMPAPNQDRQQDSAQLLPGEGGVEAMLERLGERRLRQARRLIDRLTAILEPAVILTLASLVGIVVMAAILPLIRLQEIIR